MIIWSKQPSRNNHFSVIMEENQVFIEMVLWTYQAQLLTRLSYVQLFHPIISFRDNWSTYGTWQICVIRQLWRCHAIGWRAINNGFYLLLLVIESKYCNYCTTHMWYKCVSDKIWRRDKNVLHTNNQDLISKTAHPANKADDIKSFCINLKLSQMPLQLYTAEGF